MLSASVVKETVFSVSPAANSRMESTQAPLMVSLFDWSSLSLVRTMVSVASVMIFGKPVT